MTAFNFLTGAILGDGEAAGEGLRSDVEIEEGGRGVAGRGGKSSTPPSRVTAPCGKGSELV